MQRKLARGETDIGKFVESAHRRHPARRQSDAAPARLLAPAAARARSGRRQSAGRRHVGPAAAHAGRAGRDRDRARRRPVARHADPSQLENAILNLAVNARDAMPDGGRLTIETANCHLDDAYAARHAEVRGRPVCAGRRHRHRHGHAARGRRPRRSIRSSPPSRSDRGTGLGLSQVFGFVKQSGGHVKIYSEVGQGTTVKVYLPRYFGEDEHAPAAATDREGRGRRDDPRRGRRRACAAGHCRGAARAWLQSSCTPPTPTRRCANWTRILT